MPGEKFLAFAVAHEDTLIAFWFGLFHPREQGRAEVETDPRIIVDDFRNTAFGIEDARSAVREIALARYSFVPVVIGSGRILRLNRFQPRVFARRLIKMAMNA